MVLLNKMQKNTKNNLELIDWILNVMSSHTVMAGYYVTSDRLQIFTGSQLRPVSAR